jgi:E3 ubiquitin-protein ligase DOA10
MSHIIIEFNMENSNINPLYVKPDPNECRICLEEGEYLICICGCKGTLQYVHKECIETWINSFPSDHINHQQCGICKQNYNLVLIDEQKFKIVGKDVLYLILFFYISIGAFMLIILINNL